jgi:4-amino-4-deoxy-L-arabinose transferase-like glycosyltransferase
MARQSQTAPLVAGARPRSFADSLETHYRGYFALIVAVAFLLRLACFTGLIASDDLAYSHYAQLVAQLNYKPELSQFALRFGVIVPVGIIYKLFGIAEWTTILAPLLASTASVGMLMLAGQKLFGRNAALLAGVLLATFPADIRYATILVPEPIAGAFILAALLAYLYGGDGHPVRAGLVCGLLIGVAYLTKEPSLFVAPALMIDALVRRQWRVVFGIAAGVLLIAGLEHTYYLTVTGDLMFRPHAMAQHNSSSYMLNVNQHLRWRLFEAYPKVMLLPGKAFGLHSLFAIVLTIFGLSLLKAEEWRLPLLWAAVPWIYLNFGTSSLTHYWALPSGERYLLSIYPPLFLLSAEVLLHLNSARSRTLLRIAFVLVVVSGIGCGFLNQGRGWRTDAVKKLRVIALEARSRHSRTVTVEGDNSHSWSPTLDILDHDLRQSNASETSDLLIRPDADGQPALATTSPH